MKTDLLAAASHLAKGDHEACHQMVQDDDSPDANYLHALVHRHDGDLSNALYWYRRVGNHPVLRQMAERHPGWTFEKLDETTLGEEVRLILEHCGGQ